MQKGGQLIFGLGCGLMVVIIRSWGAYPEGVTYAILFMNCLTPPDRPLFENQSVWDGEEECLRRRV